MDESAGTHSDDILRRRAGWGLAALKTRVGDLEQDTSFQGGAWAAIGGDIQTNNRACLSAMCFLLKHCRGTLEVVPDATYLSKGLRERKHVNPSGINADLWHKVGTLYRDFSGTISIRKTQAHIKEEDFINGQEHDEADYFGNASADALAARGAAFREASPESDLSFSVNRGRNFNTLRRMVAVQMFYLNTTGDQEAGERPAKPPRTLTVLQKTLITTKHDLDLTDEQKHARYVHQLPTKISCKRCTSLIDRETLVTWQKENPQCETVQRQQTVSAPAMMKPRGAIRVGRSDLHASHSLLLLNGLYWCGRCGAYTSTDGMKTSPKMLRRTCSGKTTKASQGYLRRLARGFHPRAGHNWPSLAEVRNDFESSLFTTIPRRRLHCKTNLAVEGFYGDADETDELMGEENAFYPGGSPNEQMEDHIIYDDENPFEFDNGNFDL